MLEGNGTCTNGKQLPVDKSNTALIAPHDRSPKRTLDPIVTLLHPDATNFAATTNNHVTCVCFLNPNHRHAVVTPVAATERSTSNCSKDNDDDDDSDLDDNDSSSSSSSSSPLPFQCASLVHQQQQHRANIHNRSSYCSNDTYDLAGRLLAACDTSGECYIWDLGRRHIIDSVSAAAKKMNQDRPNGPGLTIRRLSDSDADTVSTTTDHRFFYQTRDIEGTISLHDINASPTMLQTISCHSQSFCSAASCHGDSNLIVMPCSQHSHAIVRDWRMPSSDHPVAYFHGGNGMIVRTTGTTGDGSDDDDDDDDDEDEATYIDNRMKKYGMVTSLAISTCTNKARTLIVCGMENGSVVYHDLSMMSSSRKNFSVPPYSISLSATEPILALDMVPSPSIQKDNDNHVSSFVTIAGIAGNEEDLLELPVNDRGRIAVLKTSSQNDETMMQVRLRSRISTADTVIASVGSTEGSSQSIRAKPGIGQCRFRPDGRLFMVGGWDKRVRIYDRNIKGPKAHQPMAILRGHAESVNAVDWSYDAVNSGLIATGSSDGKVHVWRCFPSKSASTIMNIRE